MRSNPVKLGWLMLPIALSGCASVAEKLRSQPVAHYRLEQPGAIGPAGADANRRISFYCMDGGTSGSDGESGCAYASADYRDIVNFDPQDQAETDRALDGLLAMSDLNCSNYMHRVFSNRALTDFSGTLSEDLLTSAAAATAHIDPTASAALGVANLVVGKSMDAFHSTYFLDKTFQALEAAINGERQRISAAILTKRNKSKSTPEGEPPFSYGPAEALSDLRAYDDACSFKSGLNVLVSLAEKEQAERMQQVMRLTIAKDPNAEARCQYGVATGAEDCGAGRGVSGEGARGTGEGPAAVRPEAGVRP